LLMEIAGEVTAVNVAKGTLTLKSGTVTSGFDCEAGSLIKDIKVGDQVTVQYNEEGSKKKITKVVSVTHMNAPASASANAPVKTPVKKKAAGGK